MHSIGERKKLEIDFWENIANSPVNKNKEKKEFLLTKDISDTEF